MAFPEDLDRGGLLAEPKGGDNAAPLSVSELSGALKRTVETAFGHVRVRGEISGWKRHASGHCYFTLKDEQACIDAVIWRGQAASLAFRPEDGAEVIATGKLTTYPGRSKYQVVISRLELAGQGALMALLDKRRRQLADEGLFDSARKRPLPYLPRVIGVVTSPTGAVIRDILHRLADRCPAHVLVWPVAVQGDGAAGQVAAAIRGFAAMTPRPDVLIVARGGGSIEDLWAFNEEEVVRAAAASPIPLISAVGHETDTTLIDHAADRRAPTPTAAAEMAVPVKAELQLALSDLGHRARSAMVRGAARARERLDLAGERWPTPDALTAPHAQRLDDLADRLPRGLASRAAHARADLGQVAGRFGRHLLDTQWARLGDRLGHAAQRLPGALAQRVQQGRAALGGVGARLDPALLDRQAARLGDRLAVTAERLDPARLERRLDEAGRRLASLWRMAELAHPDRPLRKGYVRVTDRAGRTLVHAAEARQAHALELHFADGRVAATTGDGPGPVGFRPARPRPQRLEPGGKKPYPPGQPGLFGEEDE